MYISDDLHSTRQQNQSIAVLVPAPGGGVLLLDELGHVLHGVRGLVRLLLHPEQEVRAVEALHERSRVLQLEALDDTLPDLGVNTRAGREVAGGTTALTISGRQAGR